MMSGVSPSACAAPVLVLALFFAPCATFSQDVHYERFRIMAPASPGGGWDQTARSLAECLRAEGIAQVVEVENVSGAAGTIGLARFATAYRGDGDALLVTGLVMLSAILMNESPVSLAEVTPIARLTGEYEVRVGPAASPLRSLTDLATALRREPGAVSFAGGSAGGTDQLLLGLFAREVSVDPRGTNYIAFSGGGDSLAALLGNQVSAGISGLSEYAPHIESGSLRALAVSSPERLPGVDIPTFREQGLELSLANWRGLFAPPGIPRAERESLLNAVDRLVRSRGWQDVLTRNGWVDLYLPGDGFERFLRLEQRRVASLVRDLGTGESKSASSNIAEMVFPAVVGVGLLVLGASLFLTRGRPEAPPPGNRRALAFVSLGAVADVALLELAGFIAASSVLFWCAARGFGSRRWARDALLGLALSTGAYLLFTRALSLSLPAGRLFP
jgi:putative tricarboxylic transport membrane protein